MVSGWPSSSAQCLPTTAHPARHKTVIWVAFAVVAALILRLLVLASPLGDLDADEAVVGLMGRHIAYAGELPVFYYGQPYLGSLEAFSAAGVFLLVGSSSLALKLVPLVYSLGFLILSAVLARRLFGDGPAVLTAGYLALPPAMWAVWSTKARGGYAELLFLGEALLLVSLWLAERRRPIWGALFWGALGGLALWTHLLAVVYLVPAAVFVGARRRTNAAVPELAAAVVGFGLGAAPLLWANFAEGFQTLAVLGGPAGVPVNPSGELLRFFRTGLPMLAGVGLPIPPPTLALDLAWSVPTAGPLFVVIPLAVILCGVIVAHAPTARRLVARVPEPGSEPSLLVMVAIAVPLVMCLTSYGYFVAEPRYALPLYSAVPLVANAVWKLWPGVRWPTIAAVLALNVWNVLATSSLVDSLRPTVDSTPANRELLVAYLGSEDRHQMYTDYFIAYPLMFESGESVEAAVITGGPNRYLPPADDVARTPNAAVVFVRDSEPDRRFVAALQATGATTQVTTLDVYHVYTDVDRLEAALASFD